MRIGVDVRSKINGAYVEEERERRTLTEFIAVHAYREKRRISFT
jgi:hypothetical protein